MELDDAPNDRGIDLSQGSFTIKLPSCGYYSINAELLPDGIPTGRYHVFFADYTNGTSTFYVEMSNDMEWVFSETKPPFVTADMIREIGDAIESHDA